MIDEAALAQVLDTYAAGLSAEITLLHHLEPIARSQQDATAARDLSTLTTVADERERLIAGLVAIEHELQPIRLLIVANLGGCSRLPGFRAVADLHRTAAALADAIVATDQDTLTALREAEAAQRFAAQAIEAGENTLAAYRRVVAPPPSAAALLDKRG